MQTIFHQFEKSQEFHGCVVEMHWNFWWQNEKNGYFAIYWTICCWETFFRPAGLRPQKFSFLLQHSFDTGSMRSKSFISTCFNWQRWTESLLIFYCAWCLWHCNGIGRCHPTRCSHIKVEDSSTSSMLSDSKLLPSTAINSSASLVVMPLATVVATLLEILNLPLLNASLRVAETVSINTITSMGVINWFDSSRPENHCSLADMVEH